MKVVAAPAQLRLAVVLPADVAAPSVPGASVVRWSLDASDETFDPADCVVVAATITPNARAAAAIHAHAAAGGPTLGLGPGFASLCDLGLLPGRVELVTLPVAKQVCLRVEGQPTPFTAGIPAGRVLHLPANFAAAYHSPDRLSLEQSGQVVFRYCDEWAGLGDAHNPYEAPAAIAGVCNEAGHVVGLQAWLPALYGGLQAEGQSKAETQIFASTALWMAQRRTASRSGKSR